MAETQSGEQNTAKQTTPEDGLAQAVHIVNEAIHALRTRLQHIAEADEQDPILLEGETDKGYFVQLMADPAKIAQIMLDYDYPIYTVLAEEAPVEMWRELARLVGLQDVCSVDI